MKQQCNQSDPGMRPVLWGTAVIILIALAIALLSAAARSHDTKPQMTYERAEAQVTSALSSTLERMRGLASLIREHQGLHTAWLSKNTSVFIKETLHIQTLLQNFLEVDRITFETPISPLGEPKKVDKQNPGLDSPAAGLTITEEDTLEVLSRTPWFVDGKKAGFIKLSLTGRRFGKALEKELGMPILLAHRQNNDEEYTITYGSKSLVDLGNYLLKAGELPLRSSSYPMSLHGKDYLITGVPLNSELGVSLGHVYVVESLELIRSAAAVKRSLDAFLMGIFALVAIALILKVCVGKNIWGTYD